MPPCPRDLRARESIELGRVAKVKSTHTEFHGVSCVERAACRARAGGGVYLFYDLRFTTFCVCSL